MIAVELAGTSTAIDVGAAGESSDGISVGFANDDETGSAVCLEFASLGDGAVQCPLPSKSLSEGSCISSQPTCLNRRGEKMIKLTSTG